MPPRNSHPTQPAEYERRWRGSSGVIAQIVDADNRTAAVKLRNLAALDADEAIERLNPKQWT